MRRLALLFLLGAVGCTSSSQKEESPATTTLEGGTHNFSLICTPDGHAQWLYNSYGAGNMVPVLDVHGGPVLCSDAERDYRIRRAN
jgi:hypothetical protein